jgi:hypothetical protein
MLPREIVFLILSLLSADEHHPLTDIKKKAKINQKQTVFI